MIPRVLLLVGVLASTFWPFPPASAPPVGAAGVFTPAALNLTLLAGQRSSLQVQVRNTGVSPLNGAIFEAWPEPATPPAQLAVPEALRRVALPPHSSRIDPQLSNALAQAPDGQGDLLIYLRDQADLSPAYAIRDWQARGRFVYETLTSHAARSQQAIRRELERRGMPYRALWIVNALRTSGTLADVQALAAQPGVALIRADARFSLPPEDAPTQAEPDRCSPDAPGNPVCWNIRRIGADRVWNELGVTGTGITVGSLDTGVNFRHPALAASYRGRTAGGFDHDYHWFDPQGVDLEPTDLSGHGSHTTGTIAAVSNGTSTQPAVGAAPGAHWIAAQGCEQLLCAQGDLIESAQWFLAPTRLDGSDPRPDLRPMIINNSWGGSGGRDWYSGYTAAWRAAGIFPVFAAGNGSQSPPSCGSIASPGDYPEVVAVGATDRNDLIATFSLVGPASNKRLKPDFSAPGTYISRQQGILSASDIAPEYRTLQGTSMATPLVSALVALLWSDNPALIGDYDQTYAILRDTALGISDTRCGDAIGAPNNIYGYGRIDAFAAVQRARVDVPWLIAPHNLPPLAPGETTEFSITLAADLLPGPGVYRARLQLYGDDRTQPPVSLPITLTVPNSGPLAAVTGTVRDAENGQPLSATIGVLNGLRIPTDATGAYTLTLAPGVYHLAAGANSFVQATQTISVANEPIALDFLLQRDMPRADVDPSMTAILPGPGQAISTTFNLRNEGTRPLGYQLFVPNDQYGIWRSDEPISTTQRPVFAWIDLPSDAPTLSLGDNAFTNTVPLGIEFPFYSYILTDTVVTSDGTIMFVEPLLPYTGPVNRCMGYGEAFFYVIAPFRADLDPSQGGRIRYGTLTDRGIFVVSFEDVPLASNPGARFTFQTLLHSDGRITFQYQELAPLPLALSVGLQRAPNLALEIGCGPQAPIQEGLAIELHPQPATGQWIPTPDLAGTLDPGTARNLSLNLNWTRPVSPNAPSVYRARVLLLSTDPLRPIIELSLEALALPAPYEQHLPIFLAE